MNNKTIASSILALAVLAGAAILLVGGNSGSGEGITPVDNVAMVDGKQVITISAKGGYSPRVTAAKADLPTVLKVSTSGTFDCSSALAIPSLGYRKNLPPSGVVEIELPPQAAGSKLNGLCAMGMYNFSINFN
ncbi:MAG: hypothetical protein AAB455_01495 [Patescibacteria group bacterium]